MRRQLRAIFLEPELKAGGAGFLGSDVKMEFDCTPVRLVDFGGYSLICLPKCQRHKISRFPLADRRRKR